MRFLIYGLIVLAPLPFASARPVWQWLWVVTVGAMAIVHLFNTARAPTVTWPLSILWAFSLVGIFALWGFSQALLPVGDVASIGVLPVDQLLAQSGKVSVDPTKTITNAIFYLSHFVFFVLVYVFSTKRAKAVQLILFCGIIVCIYAAYGFIVFVSGDETILWLEKRASIGALTSTFVNRNSFAAFAGLGLQCLIAYAYFWAQAVLPKGQIGQELNQHNLETILTKVWWLPLAIILTATALLLTHSRAGFLSVMIAVFMLLVLSPSSYRRVGRNWSTLFGAIIAVAIVVGLFSLSGKVLESRLMLDTNFDQRLSVYPIILDAIADRPLTGFGLGTFDNVFRIYRDETISLYFDRAHSDYLELALTAGILATALIIVTITVLLGFLASSLSVGIQYRSFIALGITTTIQLALHSLVDFSLQIPAVSYMWCAILAVSAALAAKCKNAEMVIPPIIKGTHE